MYQEGQRRGLAIAALAVSLIAFINLANIEKSLLAIVLGVLAIRGATKDESAYRWGRIAIFIAIVTIILVVTLFVVYYSTLVDIVRLLHTLG
jgi:hypothetical protein